MGGVSILDKGSYFIKLFSHKQMCELFKSGYIDENLLNGLENMIKYMPNLGAEIFINFKIK